MNVTLLPLTYTPYTITSTVTEKDFIYIFIAKKFGLSFTRQENRGSQILYLKNVWPSLSVRFLVIKFGLAEEDSNWVRSQLRMPLI